MKITLDTNDVEWIVNDSGELGVKIGDQFFFLYKGESIQYGSHPDTQLDGFAIDDDGEYIKWRRVMKREFGESGPKVAVDVTDGYPWYSMKAPNLGEDL